MVFESTISEIMKKHSGLLVLDGKKARPAGGLLHPKAGATLGNHVEARYKRRSGTKHYVDNWKYYELGGLGNLITKNGCSFTCNHCIEPDAKGRTIAKRTVAADGRWEAKIRWIQNYVPESEHYRVALPTVAGDGKDDNNYADNPFLQRAVALGYKGAYYSWWRDREKVMSMPLDTIVATRS